MERGYASVGVGRVGLGSRVLTLLLYATLLTTYCNKTFYRYYLFIKVAAWYEPRA